MDHIAGGVTSLRGRKTGIARAKKSKGFAGQRRYFSLLAALLAIFLASVACADQVSFADDVPLSLMIADSGYQPSGYSATSVDPVFPGDPGDVLLPHVPTSQWHYGCTATSAGMLFSYYDNFGYVDLYDQPIPDTLDNDTTIIATDQHVADYWEAYGNTGPDPWEQEGREDHTWADCPADFLGTNQWKWDYSSYPSTDGTIDSNSDGATSVWTRGDGEKLYDFSPGTAYGTPDTSASHGMRLFAESRGYNILENYTQAVDGRVSGGFSFSEYMSEIDSYNPVMLNVTGHTMLGMGYNTTNDTVYLHDTWSNSVQSMTWNSAYEGRDLQSVIVIHFDPSGQIPEPGSLTLVIIGLGAVCYRLRRRERS
ncbi:MAG: PEP-CTERM sorting domain-containing protein [Armatimonadota bacterium]